jgi:hypothetical protein
MNHSDVSSSSIALEDCSDTCLDLRNHNPNRPLALSQVPELEAGDLRSLQPCMTDGDRPMPVVDVAARTQRGPAMVSRSRPVCVPGHGRRAMNGRRRCHQPRRSATTNAVALPPDQAIRQAAQTHSFFPERMEVAHKSRWQPRRIRLDRRHPARRSTPWSLLAPSVTGCRH